jgi:hypothetical protein
LSRIAAHNTQTAVLPFPNQENALLYVSCQNSALKLDEFFSKLCSNKESLVIKLEDRSFALRKSPLQTFSKS